ncbi:hypothetical protein AOLI_G00250940 [Acnodon oligacanthus]
MKRQEHQLEELCGMLQQLLNCLDQPNIASASTTPTTRPPVSIALPESGLQQGTRSAFLSHIYNRADSRLPQTNT